MVFPRLDTEARPEEAFHSLVHQIVEQLAVAPSPQMAETSKLVFFLQQAELEPVESRGVEWVGWQVPPRQRRRNPTAGLAEEAHARQDHPQVTKLRRVFTIPGPASVLAVAAGGR